MPGMRVVVTKDALFANFHLLLLVWSIFHYYLLLVGNSYLNIAQLNPYQNVQNHDSFIFNFFVPDQ